ncbi:hypothetical protein [Paenibacillus cymbidii]|uniref:hypothetical protein n=1 Tax=Paenibacillus cymbidii TaxID=1639034 RepID=UPI001080B5E7|nr:hypothetical protein [Paenibacillus cymbidii]
MGGEQRERVLAMIERVRQTALALPDQLWLPEQLRQMQEVLDTWRLTMNDYAERTSENLWWYRVAGWKSFVPEQTDMGSAGNAAGGKTGNAGNDKNAAAAKESEDDDSGNGA